MSSDIEVKTGYKYRTAALMTVFGLVPAAMLTCPNLVPGLPKLPLWQLLVEAIAICLVLLLFVAILAYRAFQYTRSLPAEAPDKRKLYGGEAWARWQFGPGEVQQFSWIRYYRLRSRVTSLWLLIGPYDLYNQLSGFRSISNLRGVNYYPPKEPNEPADQMWGNMARLEFVLDQYYRNSRIYQKVVVGVPHGKEAEAVVLMNRFIRERLQGRNG